MYIYRCGSARCTCTACRRRPSSSTTSGTQFTCFTGKTVQILTSRCTSDPISAATRLSLRAHLSSQSPSLRYSVYLLYWRRREEREGQKPQLVAAVAAPCSCCSFLQLLQLLAEERPLEHRARPSAKGPQGGGGEDKKEQESGHT
jgi:hypothetical protein